MNLTVSTAQTRESRDARRSCAQAAEGTLLMNEYLSSVFANRGLQHSEKLAAGLSKQSTASFRRSSALQKFEALWRTKMVIAALDRAEGFER
jgi:hypothetical protein